MKQRVHLDVHVEDVEDVLALGATPLDVRSFRWKVLRDPEGGELCAFEREEVPEDRLYELVVDCATRRRATMVDRADRRHRQYDAENGWSGSRGCPTRRSPIRLRAGAGAQDRQEPDPLRRRDRRPVALVPAGATVLRAQDDEIGWTVLADPEGNEFCAFVVRAGDRERRLRLTSRVPSMTKWEYLTAPILTHAAKQMLDNFGTDGWELVQVAPGMNPENLVGYFKRPQAVSAPEERLAALGLSVPEVAKPVAVYVPAVRSGRPRLHLRPAADAQRRADHDRQGRRRGEPPRRLRLRAAVRAQRDRRGQGRDRRPALVKRVVKVVVFVASTPDFTGQPGVANGASELLGKVFGDAGVHARSAVGVPLLPLDAPVEVELLVEV